MHESNAILTKNYVKVNTTIIVKIPPEMQGTQNKKWQKKITVEGHILILKYSN